jgi:1,4-dihydroxy-2-naphthoate octaprenyltransferase
MSTKSQPRAWTGNEAAGQPVTRCPDRPPLAGVGRSGERSLNTAPELSPTRWQEALNPPIYLVSVLPGLGVPLLAQDAVPHPFGLVLATLAVVLLQHAINLFNDAADWRLGADKEKSDSWVRVHAGRPEVAVMHGALSLLAGGLLGLAVLWWLGQWWLLWIAAPLLALGYLYNAGPRPLSYTHLGEWVTGLCYGPGVFGCLWLVAGLPASPAMVAGMVAFAALAAALLLSHQPPQIDTDRQAGKLSFAVRFGVDRTVSVARWLSGIFLAAVGGTFLVSRPGAAGVLFAAFAALIAYRQWRGPVNPRRVLLAASAFMALGLVLQLPVFTGDF